MQPRENTKQLIKLAVAIGLVIRELVKVGGSWVKVIITSRSTTPGHHHRHDWLFAEL